MRHSEVTLATGIWREGTRARRARLVAPTPEEERALFEAGEPLLPAERVTLILGRCAEVGGETGPDAARALSSGDRVALLLQLRRLLAGESLPCVLDCPWPDCGERLELELRTSELVPRGDSGPPEHELEFRGERVSFRLPTGADEELAAHVAVEDGPEAAVEALMRACLTEPPAAPRPGLDEALGTAIASIDPHAEISLVLRCPACERDGEVAFDAASYLWLDLEARLARLDQDVHLLASRYGWSEADILGLDESRRARYIRLVQMEPA
jgi:hypothetical protein